MTMKKDKRKFRINIIDVLVLVVIAILIVAAFAKFNKFNTKTEESSDETIFYSIDIFNVRDFSADAYKSGDVVYDSLTGVNIGTIEEIKVINAEGYEIAENGSLVKVINPYRRDVTLKIKTPGTVENNAYYANKSIELKVNSSKTIETKYAKTTGTISSINIECE